MVVAVKVEGKVMTVAMKAVVDNQYSFRRCRGLDGSPG